MFGRQSILFVTAREASCHHTLHWTPFFKCTLASSRRCAANNLFIYSSRPRYSRLVAASWSWKCNSARNEKGLRNALRIKFNVPCGRGQGVLVASRVWMSSIPEPTFVLGGVRVDMGCMNLVTCYFEVYAGTRNINIMFLCQRLGVAQEEGLYSRDKMSDPAYQPHLRFRLALRLQNGGRICGTLR